MPDNNQRQTIEQELKQREIDGPYFSRFYQELRGNNKIPNPEGYSWQQYKLLVDYLKDQNVLNETNQIKEDGLNLFVKRKELEDILKTRTRRRVGPRNTGGMLPCRERDRSGRSGGGIAPCNTGDYDFDEDLDDLSEKEGKKT